MSEKSRHCDRSEHGLCDGTVKLMEQDGVSSYVCACGCHNRSVDERDCATCGGTGKLHQELRWGRWQTIAGPLREENAMNDRICGMVCNCGPNGEPLACGYPLGHDGEHAWATLPTWTQGAREVEST